MPALPAASVPASAPVMAADSLVRTYGFALPTTGSFVVGHYGPQVGALQAHLAALGYLSGTPDQFYANGTVEAVKYFQMEYGLPVTGLFDLAAYQTMMAVFSGQLRWKRAPQPATVATQPTPAPTPSAATTSPQNPLGMEWVTAPQPSTQQPPAQTSNPLGVEWVSAPQPQPATEAKPKAEPKPEPKPETKTETKTEKKSGSASTSKSSSSNAAIEALKKLTPAELANLGATNKKKFFEVLRPAAEEAERKYGVPAAITLAQAALETGWGKSIIEGYNLFGIKGKGPAGTVSKKTWEVYNGKKVTITANFAKYHNFYEAVAEHGKLFHNGYYTKAMEAYKKNKDPFEFARLITGIYATDPQYGDKLISIMKTYNLV